VPQYLDGRIKTSSDFGDEDPTVDPIYSAEDRLCWFHEYLSHTRDKKQLTKCVWVSTVEERTCIYSDRNTIAENLDIFQKGLSAAKDCPFSLFAVNVNAGCDFEWYYRRVPTRVYFLELVRIIVRDHWLESDIRIAQTIRYVRTTSTSQLEWESKLPSDISLHETSHCGEPSILGLDITLEWLHDHPEINKLVGFRDWSIDITEPYTRRPNLDILRIVDVTAPDSTEYRIALVTTSGDALECLKEAHDRAMRMRVIDLSSDADDQMFKSLIASFRVVILIVCRYIKGSAKVAQDLVRPHHNKFANNYIDVS